MDCAIKILIRKNYTDHIVIFVLKCDKVVVVYTFSDNSLLNLDISYFLSRISYQTRERFKY